jgi:hypothetical protein
MFLHHFNNRFENLESRFRVTIYLIFIFSAILSIALTVYYDQMSVSEKNRAYDFLYERIISPIPQFIDLIYIANL